MLDGDFTNVIHVLINGTVTIKRLPLCMTCNPEQYCLIINQTVTTVDKHILYEHTAQSNHYYQAWATTYWYKMSQATATLMREIIR